MSIKPEKLGEAIEEQLTTYGQDVIEKIDKLSEAAANELVQKTKLTAPVGARGDFRKSISSKLATRTARSSTYVWYVKAPNHRLTHLLVHGHATRNGSRTKADPFLANALAEVLPQYERDLEEAVKND